MSKPLGEWNTVRLIAKGTHVEQWMNDVKVVEYELFSPDWEAAGEEEQVRKYPKYGRPPRTHRDQDHGEVWFRNIRIRSL